MDFSFLVIILQEVINQFLLMTTLLHQLLHLVIYHQNHHLNILLVYLYWWCTVQYLLAFSYILILIAISACYVYFLLGRQTMSDVPRRPAQNMQGVWWISIFEFKGRVLLHMCTSTNPAGSPKTLAWFKTICCAHWHRISANCKTMQLLQVHSNTYANNVRVLLYCKTKELAI